MKLKNCYLTLGALCLALQFGLNASAFAECLNSYKQNPNGKVIREYPLGGNCSQSYSVNVQTYTPNATPGVSNIACEGSIIPNGFLTTRVELEVPKCGPAGYGQAYGYGLRESITIPKTDGSITVICPARTSVDEIPEGFVITNKYKDNRCRVSTTQDGYAYEIQTPNLIGETTMCSGTPIPAGYVENDSGSGKSVCKVNSTDPGHYKIIQKSDSGILCIGNPLHDGYAVVETGQYRQCRTSTTLEGPGYKIEKIEDAQGEVRICSHTTVPEGFVIIGRESTTSCAAGTFLVIRKPISSAGGMPVCQGSVIPDPFVITSRTELNQCSVDGSGNAMIIETPPSSGSLDVCAGSTIPAGYGFTNLRTDQAKCGSSNPHVYTIEPIKSGSTYCEGRGSVPPGMVITEIKSYQTQCNGGYGYTVSYPEENGETTACTGPDIPNGYVVVQNSAEGCGISGGVMIEKPDPSGTTVVCSTFTVPSGFAMGDVVSSYTRCGDLPAYELSPISGQGPFYVCGDTEIPNAYVTVESKDFPQCASYIPPIGYKIELPSAGNQYVCRSSNVPEGFVIKSIEDKSASCNDKPLMKIGYPSSAGTTPICKNEEGEFDVPDGYEIDTYVNGASWCNGGNGAKIKPYGVIPLEFIKEEPDVTSEDVNQPSVSCSGTSGHGAFVNNAVKNSCE